MRPVLVSRFPLIAVVLAGGFALASSSLHAGNRAIAVSPGAEHAAPAVGGTCPTFSWGLADGAESYELVVLDLVDPERPRPVLEGRFAGGIGSWTPSGEQCLAPSGNYSWTVRALDMAAQPMGGEAAWSVPLRFSVPGLPTAEEVAAALAVLERWQAAGGTTGTGSLARGPVEAGGGRLTVAAPIESAAGRVERPVANASGNSAIRGENAVATGANFGVTGISSSSAGAGLVGINVSSGPDLILDGVANGEADTTFSQSGIDRPAAAAQTFNIQNSGAGALTLQVDGVAVDTSTSAIAWSRLNSVPAGFADGVDNDTTYTAGNQLQLISAQLNVLEGSGSGLDADTLDGAHGTSFQTRVTGICPLGQAMQGVNVNGSVVCVALPAAPAALITALDPGFHVGQFTSLAVNDLDFPVISYYSDDQFNTGGLKVVKCGDLTCVPVNGFPTRTIVDNSANDVGSYTSLAIGSELPNGLPVISYYDATAGNLKVAKCNDRDCLGNDESITTVDSSANDVGRNTSLAIGTDGFPVISYYDASASDLKVAKCNDPACAPGGETITTVISVNSVGLFSSIAIGNELPDGFPVISYYESTGGNLKVAKCTNASCSTSTIATIDSVDQVGPYNSIAIGTDGFPVISYYDVTGGNLKVAKCSNASCSASSFSTVDSSTNDVGQYTSIAIGADGFPVIGYYDVTAGNLKVAKCNDPACNGNDETVTTVDSSVNNVGQYCSLAISANGFPVISYWDLTAWQLKVAMCLSPSCSF